MVLRQADGLNLYKSYVLCLCNHLVPDYTYPTDNLPPWAPPRWTTDHILSIVARQVGVPSRGCAPLGVVRAGPLASQMGIFFTDVVIRDNSGSYGGRPSRSTS